MPITFRKAVVPNTEPGPLPPDVRGDAMPVRVVLRPRHISDDEMAAFLGELKLLTLKHGIAISGCGCCGSPSLDRVITDDGGEYAYDEMLEWVSPHNKGSINLDAFKGDK